MLLRVPSHFFSLDFALVLLLYIQYLNCRGDASLHRDFSVGWSDKKEPVRTNKSFKFRPNIVPNCGEDLFFILNLHPISGKKHFNFRRRPFFCFGLHLILATELQNFHWSTFTCQMRLVKAAKAFPPCKILQFKYCVYALSQKIGYKQFSKTLYDIYFCLMDSNKQQIYDRRVNRKTLKKHALINQSLNQFHYHITNYCIYNIAVFHVMHLTKTYNTW